MKFLFKICLLLFLLCLLIGRNLPFESYYFYGLGPWDFLAISIFPFLDYKKIPKNISLFIFLFIVVASVGLLINVGRSIRINDFFEILRLFYSYELIALGLLFGRNLKIK